MVMRSFSTDTDNRPIRTTSSAFVTVALAAAVVGGANAALVSLIHTYAQPDRVAMGLVAMVDVIRILSLVCLGAHN
jgi:hypothetical protein